MGPSPSDPELVDTVLGEEIELLGALISRAAQTQGCLTDEEVDAVLFAAAELPSAG